MTTVRPSALPCLQLRNVSTHFFLFLPLSVETSKPEASGKPPLLRKLAESRTKLMFRPHFGSFSLAKKPQASTWPCFLPSQISPTPRTACPFLFLLCWKESNFRFTPVMSERQARSPRHSEKTLSGFFHSSFSEDPKSKLSGWMRF